QSSRAQAPDDPILSEENDTTYPGHANPAWVVDPLDGTSNFSLGVHYWGVSIARIVNGWPEIGVLYFPVIGELYAAWRGGGAKLNGGPLHVGAAALDHPVAFFTCDSRLHKYYRTSIRYKCRTLGSAAYNFCAIARGASVVGFESIPKIWDIAASWLILKEAGGAIHPYEENPFPMTPGKDYTGVSFPILGAASEELLADARKKIVENR
ncbi:MAG: inositol monophosphatase family protein, partial [Anaerolineales bacterium]